MPDKYEKYARSIKDRVFYDVLTAVDDLITANRELMEEVKVMGKIVRKLQKEQDK